MRFHKYHGTGNDFIVINAMEGGPFLPPDGIAALCRRNTGIGADGIIFACGAVSGVDAAMRLFNADGSEAEMSGNGIRCLAKFLYEREGICKENLLIDTKAGIKALALTLENGQVKEAEVDMGLPDYIDMSLPVTEAASRPGEVRITVGAGEEFDAFCLSMGNPHCVIFVEDVINAPVSRLGPLAENHKLFPHRTNVEFAELVDTSRLLLRVWERGVGETASCGTGACAAFAAALHTGKGKSPMIISLPGGDLRTRVDRYGHIFLTGPVVEVYSGELNPLWEI